MSQPSTFTALLVEEQDDKTFSKHIVQRSISDLPDNDLLIEVHYSSLNYKDAMSASGNKRRRGSQRIRFDRQPAEPRLIQPTLRSQRL